MAAYARIYGFQTYAKREVIGHEDDFTCIDNNCFMSNGDYEMLEEILDKEF